MTSTVDSLETLLHWSSNPNEVGLNAGPQSLLKIAGTKAHSRMQGKFSAETGAPMSKKERNVHAFCTSTRRDVEDYFSLACLRTGTSGSTVFRSSENSRYAARLRLQNPPLVRFDSSINVSGHTAFSSSSFKTTFSLFSSGLKV